MKYRFLVTSCVFALFVSAGHAFAGTSAGVFSVGTNADVNTNGNSYVAYLFDEIPGFSRFGSYTGNGSADGPFVYTGFKPKYWLVKPSGLSDSWRILDTGRSSTGNPIDDGLWGDANSAEASNNSNWTHDFLTNGVKVRSSNQAFNSSGITYVYAAFAEAPFREQYSPYNLTIASSTRFNDDDSAYLSRTFGTPTSQNVFTFSAWVKRANTTTLQNIFGVSTNYSLGFPAADTLAVTIAGVAQATTAGLYRDSSAWMHVIYVQNGTAITVYVNGVSVATGTGTNSQFNTAVAHQIGASNTSNFLDGYLSDIYFVDGQALTPSSFGESDTNGNWKPKSYSGSYGTNGFHLDFANASDPGNDVSGNNNDWTANNIDTTDNVIDTPTNNFATWSPVVAPAGGHGTLSNGNVNFTGGDSTAAITTQAVTSGKWYVELWHPDGTYNGYGSFGVTQLNQGIGTYNCYYAIYASRPSICRDTAGSAKVGAYGVQLASVTSLYDATAKYTAIALDMDSKKIWFGYAYSGAGSITWDSGDPNAGTGGYDISPYLVPGEPYAIDMDGNRTTNHVLVAGAIPKHGAETFTYNSSAGGYFKYTPPMGFKALSTANLPSANITKPSNYFEAKTYTGNGSTQSITGLNFQPNFTWIKDRSAATSSLMFDSVRGATNYLSSNATTKELTAANTLTSFDADGFSLGAATGINTNTNSYIAWNWKEGATSGLDVVTYTGNGTNRLLSHSLASPPEFIIVKDRSGANDWAVYHAKNTAAPETDYLLLNSGVATADDNTYWNDMVPGSGIMLTETAMVTGSTTVFGTISKGSGTFVIDHPLDPVNKLLYHSFLESPDVKNLYDGIVTLDRRGRVTIRLPKYFLALNKEFRYLASPISEAMPNLHIKRGVRKKYWLWGPPVFTIAGGAPGGKISWQVTGIRKDRFIEENPIKVEVDKGADQPVDVGECIFPPLCNK